MPQSLDFTIESLMTTYRFPFHPSKRPRPLLECIGSKVFFLLRGGRCEIFEQEIKE